MNIVGREMDRVDAYAKVTGEAKFTADLEPKEILHAKVVHSTIANGWVKSIDTSEAEQVPGVVKIVTCLTVPDLPFPTAGHPWSVEARHQDICDRKLLNRRVRYYGDDIAAVVAEDEVAAARAARLIKVEYEEYPPIVSVEAAMQPDATPLHPEVRKDNVIAHSHMVMGEDDFTYEAAVKEAEEKYGRENLIELSEDYDTPRISQSHIELVVSWAYEEPDGKICVTSSTQIPHIVRNSVAMALGLPVGRVRIIKPYIGGGFGNKQDVLYEPLNAYLSLQCGGRAVRLEASREEVIVSTRTRHKIEGRCRALMTKDGTFLARKLEAYANNGAYASHGHAICANCGTVFKDLYRDRLGTEVDCWTVYTTGPVGGAMRAYGIPQSDWFAECLTDDLAAQIGMDPLQLRLANCIEAGFRDPGTGISFYTYGLKDCIEKGRQYIHWDDKWDAYRHQTGSRRKGIGMAIFIYKTGVYPISLETASARLVLNQDGSAQLFLGATEIGQGADTVFTQMAAETTGISPDKIYIESTQDTDTSPFDTGAYASRQTYVTGKAVKKCAEEFRGKLLDYAAYMLNHADTDLARTVYGDQVKAARAKAEQALALDPAAQVTAAQLAIADNAVVLAGSGEKLFELAVVGDVSFYSLDRSQHITAEVTNHCKENSFASGVTFAEIEVDIPLGLVEVKNIINVHDSGVLINPKTAESQVHGGMAQSLGFGLSEEMLVDEKTGRTLNDNLLDFKIPTAMDLPHLEAQFVELDDPTGPYGNKALGEPPAISPAPAVRNAILNATGVHMNVAPMTSQRLVEAFDRAGLISRKMEDR